MVGIDRSARCVVADAVLFNDDGDDGFSGDDGGGAEVEAKTVGGSSGDGSERPAMNSHLERGRPLAEEPVLQERDGVRGGVGVG